MEQQTPLDLRAIARLTMIENGFKPDLPVAAIAQADELATRPLNAFIDQATVRDLRGFYWSSIDNRESLDLDQIEYVEQLNDGQTRVLVGIADVDAYVRQDSLIDQQAADNATSVYTGIETFSMLPERLSTDLTSLLEEVDRLAIIIEMVINRDGIVESREIYRGLVRNRAKLDYESVGAWLEARAPMPEKVAASAELREQLQLQDEVALQLRARRQQRGALDFESIEAKPVTKGDQIIDLTLREKNRARYLIENFMVTANSVMAGYLLERGTLSIQRVVKRPERWPRIVDIAATFGVELPVEPDAPALAQFLAARKAAAPEHYADLSLSIVKLLGAGEYAVVEHGIEHEGHFGLAAQDYTHSTAPNRRYIDLITQRLLKAVIAAAPVPYNLLELHQIAEHCTERDKAARKVELKMRKSAAAMLIKDRIGEQFEGIITGVTKRGIYLRLITPPIEGRLTRQEVGGNAIDVGDKVKVKLISVVPENGYIDFDLADE